MTKLQIMEKIADYRSEYDHYDMGPFVCEHFAKILPKWVLEELLKQCDYKHSIVMHKDRIYSYWHDSYAHDFDYYVKDRLLYDPWSNTWCYCGPNGICEVVHD